MFVCAALNKKNNYFQFKYPVSHLAEADCTADISQQVQKVRT